MIIYKNDLLEYYDKLKSDLNKIYKNIKFDLRYLDINDYIESVLITITMLDINEKSDIKLDLEILDSFGELDKILKNMIRLRIEILLNSHYYK